MQAESPATSHRRCGVNQGRPAVSGVRARMPESRARGRVAPAAMILGALSGAGDMKVVSVSAVVGGGPEVESSRAPSLFRIVYCVGSAQRLTGGNFRDEIRAPDRRYL